MFNKMMVWATVIALLAARSHAEDYVFPERAIPRDVVTFDDYHRYKKARKASVITGIVCGVLSVAAITYAEQLDRKAGGMRITSDTLVPTGPGLPGRYPIQQDRLEARGRVESQAKVARTAGIALGLGSLLAFSLAVSIRF